MSMIIGFLVLSIITAVYVVLVVCCDMKKESIFTIILTDLMFIIMLAGCGLVMGLL